MRCHWFVLRIWSNDAALEVNCPFDKCQTTLRIRVEDGRIAIEAVPKKKKA